MKLVVLFFLLVSVAFGSYVPVAYDSDTGTFKPTGVEEEIYSDADAVAAINAAYPGLVTDGSVYMQKSVYDTDLDGVVDDCEQVQELLDGLIDQCTAPWYNWQCPVDANGQDLQNVGNGEFESITLGGVTITSWTTTEDGVVILPGNILLQVDYPTSGRSKDGTIHFEAYDSEAMYGWPIYEAEYDVSNLAAGPSYQIPIQANLIGQTWWYAWFDSNEDEIFNDYSEISETTKLLGVEPGALAEHNPQIISTASDAKVIRFNLVDKKGTSPRIGWAYTDVNSSHDIQAKIISTEIGNANIPASDFTLTGGGSHGGNAWHPANGSTICGVHNYIGDFLVGTNETIYIKGYSSTDQSGGWLVIFATNIFIYGTIEGSNRGYPGGNGGGGGGGSLAHVHDLVGAAGARGTGNGVWGGVGTAGIKQNPGYPGFDGGSGGIGAVGWGPYRGDPTTTSIQDWISGGCGVYAPYEFTLRDRQHGVNAGYNAIGANNREALKSHTLYIGSGGSGGSGGAGSGGVYTGSLPTSAVGAGGGGGGAGGNGGAAIWLYASGKATSPTRPSVEIMGIGGNTARINVKGGNTSGNGSNGGNATAAASSASDAGAGGAGGSTSISGTGLGGSGGTAYQNISSPNCAVIVYPYSGGNGGQGAGGGILIKAPNIRLDHATLDASAGTGVGGAVKIFHEDSGGYEKTSAALTGGQVYEYPEQIDIPAEDEQIIQVFDTSIRNRRFLCEIDYLSSGRGGLPYSYPYELMNLQLFEIPATTPTVEREFLGIDVFGDGSNQGNAGPASIAKWPSELVEINSNTVEFTYSGWDQYSTIQLEMYESSPEVVSSPTLNAGDIEGDLGTNIKTNSVVFVVTITEDETETVRTYHTSGLNIVDNGSVDVGDVNYVTGVFNFDYSAPSGSHTVSMVQYYALFADVPIYSYLGYMENTRSSTGNKYHLASEERNGLVLVEDNYYMWRLRSLPNVVSSEMPAGEWSEFALFYRGEDE